MRRNWCALAMVGCLLLSGCGKQVSDDADVRNHWTNVEALQADVNIATNLGDEVLEYQLQYVYNGNDSDQFTITYPETLAGIGGIVTGEDAQSLKIMYEDTILEDLMPVRAGMTPADAFGAILRCLKQEVPTESWTESVSGQTLLVLRYEDTDAVGELARQVWLTADGKQVVCAEVYDGSTCIMTVTVSGYQ